MPVLLMAANISNWLRSHWSQLWAQPGTHARLFVDQPPTWEDWRLHRSPAWRHRVEPIMFMRLAVGFSWQLVLVVTTSILVGLYHEFIVPLGAPAISQQVTAPYSMMTFVVSLLLVFKTNSSYARWWEGRIIWGQIVNYARNLPRMLLAFAPPDSCTPAQLDILCAALRWAAASPHVLRGHIREPTHKRAEDEAAHLLTRGEREYLRQHWSNKPQGVAHVLSWLSTHRLLHLRSIHQMALQEQITLYVNMAGGCERILRTRIPSAYSRHTSRFLLLYITLSPLLLWPSLGWVTPAAAALIATLLLGAENIGVQIEEPFRVLPLEAYTKGMELGIRDIAAASLGYDLTPPPCHMGPSKPEPPGTPGRPSPAAAMGPPGAPQAAPPRPVGPLANSVLLAHVLGLDQQPEVQQLYSLAPAAGGAGPGGHVGGPPGGGELPEWRSTSPRLRQCNNGRWNEHWGRDSPRPRCSECGAEAPPRPGPGAGRAPHASMGSMSAASSFMSGSPAELRAHLSAGHAQSPHDPAAHRLPHGGSSAPLGMGLLAHAHLSASPQRGAPQPSARSAGSPPQVQRGLAHPTAGMPLGWGDMQAWRRPQQPRSMDSMAPEGEDGDTSTDDGAPAGLGHTSVHGGHEHGPNCRPPSPSTCWPAASMHPTSHHQLSAPEAAAAAAAALSRPSSSARLLPITIQLSDQGPDPGLAQAQARGQATGHESRQLQPGSGFAAASAGVAPAGAGQPARRSVEAVSASRGCSIGPTVPAIVTVVHGDSV